MWVIVSVVEFFSGSNGEIYDGFEPKYEVVEVMLNDKILIGRNDADGNQFESVFLLG